MSVGYAGGKKIGVTYVYPNKVGCTCTPLYLYLIATLNLQLVQDTQQLPSYDASKM